MPSFYVSVFESRLTVNFLLRTGAIHADASVIRVDGKTDFSRNSAEGQLTKFWVMASYTHNLARIRVGAEYRNKLSLT